MARKRHPKAVSLIFSIIIVTIVVIVGGTMATSFLRASQRNYDLFRSNQAYYAARASLEKAVAEVSANNTGYENSDTAAIDWTDVGATGEFEIYSQAKMISWQSGNTTYNNCSYGLGIGFVNCYVTPIPGTGDASSSCDFQDTDEDWNTDWDDECNWSTIAYGETVSIPLFYSEGGTIYNPKDSGLYNFSLRMRTEDGQVLNSTLDDEVLVNWQISGTCSGGIACSLVPQEAEPGGFGGGDPGSQIKGENINDAIEYEVLNESDYIGTIAYTKDEGILSYFFSLLDDNTETYLQLSVIYALTDYPDGDPISHLEYQVLTDQPISDSKVVYMAEGQAEGQLGDYIYPLTATQSSGSAPVINFAIQN